MTFGKTDHEAIRARLQARQNRKEGDKRFWKPEIPNGKETVKAKIRILPPTAGQTMWFVEHGMHYRIGEDIMPQVCPKITFKKACPICEFTKKLWQGTEEDKNLARRIGGKRRFASNIVTAEDPKTVRIFTYGVMIWEQLCEFSVGDDGMVPLDDPKKGHDITISVKTERTGNNVFPKYHVIPSLKATALTDESVLENMHDLTEAVVGDVKSYDELKSILLGSDTEPETETETETPETTVEQGDTDVDETEAEVEVETTSNEGGVSLAEKAKQALKNRKR